MLHWDDKHLTFTQMILKLILQFKKYKLEVMKTVMGMQNTVTGNIVSDTVITIWCQVGIRLIGRIPSEGIELADHYALLLKPT